VSDLEVLDSLFTSIIKCEQEQSKMFQLAILEDKLICTPDQINRDPFEVLVEQIELKFVNKVIINVGLGIAFYDFVTVGDPYLYPGAGSAIRLVRFRLVIFKPFISEIVVGRISSLNKDEVRVSLDFFEDIVIPNSQLQQPSVFDPQERRWTWTYEESEGEDGSPLQLTLDVGDQVRFKVRSITFTSVTISSKGMLATVTSEEQTNHQVADPNAPHVPMVRRRSSSIGLSSDQDVPVAMRVTGVMNDFGLGGVSWW